MRIINQTIKLLSAAMLVVLMGSCEKDYFYETPPPKTSHQTSTLEASRANTPPSTINAAFWKTADYLKIVPTNVSTNQLYSDGLLNMTGIFEGLSQFNNGVDPGVSLKAGYDDVNLYILVEWTDSDVNVSNSSWLWNGPLDPRKTELANGWTSQRNCDRLGFAFEISPASSAAGSFSSVGCAASCHTAGNNAFMFPDAGKVDLWSWNLARSAPLGYAEDMVANADSLASDGGQKMHVRNSSGSTNRSGPAFEWDGTPQSVTLPTGQSSTLDPAYYLVNKTTFTGDAARGDSIYHKLTPPGDCVGCHGEHGEGGSNGPINTISMNKKSRSALILAMDGQPDMVTYWGPLSGSDRNDIVAYLRGLSGVPGYYLTSPDGSNADVLASSNVTAVQIKNAMLPSTNQHTKYQVLITRKLNTGNTDDVMFDSSTGRTYKFGFALMDNDGKNHIGSLIETLTFK